MTTTDAVVIGSGPNGLVAANLLVDAGWSVVVLEEQDRPGGAVWSDDSVAPAHVHDTFSSFYPLAAGSPTIRALHLEQHGLEWVQAPAVVGHSFPDGRWGMLHRERQATAMALDEHAPGDGNAWLALCDTWDRVGDDVIRCLLSPFPPVRGGAGLARQVLRPGGLELLREMVMPARTLTERLFRGEGSPAARRRERRARRHRPRGAGVRGDGAAARAPGPDRGIPRAARRRGGVHRRPGAAARVARRRAVPRGASRGRTRRGRSRGRRTDRVARAAGQARRAGRRVGARVVRRAGVLERAAVAAATAWIVSSGTRRRSRSTGRSTDPCRGRAPPTRLPARFTSRTPWTR